MECIRVWWIALRHKVNRMGKGRLPKKWCPPLVNIAHGAHGPLARTAHASWNTSYWFVWVVDYPKGHVACHGRVRSFYWGSLVFGRLHDYSYHCTHVQTQRELMERMHRLENGWDMNSIFLKLNARMLTPERFKLLCSAKEMFNTDPALVFIYNLWLGWYSQSFCSFRISCHKSLIIIHVF